MSGRVLLAMVNQMVVGSVQEINGLWSFQYTPAWLNNPARFAISPHLPLLDGQQVDGASVRPVQWYFDNLLPEEGQRILLARDASLEVADAFGLLAWYGAESAGSLTLLPPEAKVQAGGALRALSDAVLAARIAQLPHVPLTHTAVKRMSLAGAQHKLALVVQDGQLYEPEGVTPSSHILKPDHPDRDYPHSAINEWFVMRLARRLGLDVPDCERRYVPAPVYLVSRFDRHMQGGQRQRLHAIDACQLLGLDRSFKYQQGSIANLAALAAACRSPAVARSRLYGWLVFNILVGNTDAHLKNLSFLVSHEGIQLAPFYDLLSVAAYETRAYERESWPDQTELAWPVLGVHRHGCMNRELLLEAGLALGLARGTAERLLDNLRSRIGRESDALYAAMEAENQALGAAVPTLKATLAGEARCIRVIVYNIIKETAARIAPAMP